jgi:hypothetical protein
LVSAGWQAAQSTSAARTTFAHGIEPTTTPAANTNDQCLMFMSVSPFFRGPYRTVAVAPCRPPAIALAVARFEARERQS